jgi:hypothetical protein
VKCDCSRLRVIKRRKFITGHTTQCSTCSKTRRVAPLPKNILIVHGIAFANGRKI